MSFNKVQAGDFFVAGGMAAIEVWLRRTRGHFVMLEQAYFNLTFYSHLLLRKPTLKLYSKVIS